MQFDRLNLKKHFCSMITDTCIKVISPVSMSLLKKHIISDGNISEKDRKVTSENQLECQQYG